MRHSRTSAQLVHLMFASHLHDSFTLKSLTSESNHPKQYKLVLDTQYGNTHLNKHQHGRNQNGSLVLSASQMFHASTIMFFFFWPER